MPGEMNSEPDRHLEMAIAGITLPGVKIGYRLISPGDEHRLMPEEIAAFAGAVIQVRRASGAARIVARELLAQFGHACCPLPKGTGGAPVWPIGIIGSMAHDDTVAIAAISNNRSVGAVGVDIEPAGIFPCELLELVATPTERLRIFAGSDYGTLLFTIKEAVYKATYPLDGRFLDPQDIEVDIPNRRATICNGRVVGFNFCLAKHIVTMAYLPANLR